MISFVIILELNVSAFIPEAFTSLSQLINDAFKVEFLIVLFHYKKMNMNYLKVM